MTSSCDISFSDVVVGSDEDDREKEPSVVTSSSSSSREPSSDLPVLVSVRMFVCSAPED